MRVQLAALWMVLGVACMQVNPGGEGPIGEGRVVVEGDVVADHSWDSDFVLDFGAVRVGETVERTVVLRNAGSGPAKLSPLELSAPFSGDLLTGETLAPGAKRPVRVSFTPAEVWPAESIVTVIASARPVSILLRGAGLPPPSCKPELDPALLFEWSEYDPPVLQQPAEIRNTGDGDCIVESVALRGSTAFKLGLVDDTVARPGETARLYVQFDRFEDPAASGTLELVVSGQRFSVSLNGRERFAGPCDLVVDPSVGFGTVGVGTTRERTVELHNRGAETCPEGAIQLDAEGFTAEGAIPALAAGETAAVTVDFAPVRTGLHRGRLLLLDAEGSSWGFELPVFGYAVASCALYEPSLDFGEVAAGCAIGERLLEIVNQCSDPLVATNVDIPSEGDSTEFRIRRRPPGIADGVAIPSGEQISFTLAYVPKDEGEHEGLVRIAFLNHPPVDARLYGRSGPNPSQTDNFSQPGWEGPRSRFFLSGQPQDRDHSGSIEDPNEIQVELNDIAYPSVGEDGSARWHYESANNAIDFEPGYVPPDGTSIKATYYYSSCVAP